MSIANLLAQHVPLIRDAVAPTPPPSPPPPSPAPPPSPTPPPATTPPPTFTVVAVPTAELTRTTLISPAKTLATITTSEASVRVDTSAAIPGCTFSLTGSPPTACVLNGTPTVAGITRVFLTYVRDDGTNTVLGSSTHDISVLDAAVLMVIGDQQHLTVRRGDYVDTLLCEPEIAQNIPAVYASRSMSIWGQPGGSAVGTRGDIISFAWTPAATSSGALRVWGVVDIPPGVYTLNVDYYMSRGPGLGIRVLGSSAHTITVLAPGSAAAPPPAATPAPPAPAPSPGPAPPAVPTPPPLPVADPNLASVLLLTPMGDTLTLGGGDGSTAALFPSTIGPDLAGQWAQDGTASTVGVSCSVPDAWAYPTAAQTVECFVKMDTALSGLNDTGASNILIPVLTYKDGGGTLTWLLGILFEPQQVNGTWQRVPKAIMIRRKDDGSLTYVISAATSTLGTFAHLAATTSDTATGLWLAGDATNAAGTGLNRLALSSGRIYVAGLAEMPARFTIDSGFVCDVRPMAGGVVKEVRLTSLQRYTPGTDLTAAQLVHPWPNY